MNIKKSKDEQFQDKNYLCLVFDLPINREFHYCFPEKLKEKVSIGKRVSAPFGQRVLPGFIVGFSRKPAIPKTKVKEIFGVLDKQVLVNKEILRLSRWISQYYFCSWGRALFEAVPAAVKKGEPKRQSPEQYVGPLEDHPDENLWSGGFTSRKQTQALAIINEALINERYDVLLLFGVEGSGKTEVFLQGISYCLKKGKQAIVLVPEVSNIPQIMGRFINRFGGQVAVLHSELSRGEHYAQWQKIKSGEKNIVIGTRSAVFAPVKNLGMIVVDEEHNNAYKQCDAPKYHAREVACQRARMNKALVVLSSATPSLESFYQAEGKKFKIVSFPKRVDKKPFFEVKIVDMSKEGLKGRVLSLSLEAAIKERIEKGEQTILFLNRRGFATSLLCRQCGFVLLCPDCNVPLIFHQPLNIACCHYCTYRQKVPRVCPRCFSSYIRYAGLGTQKLEEKINKYFEGARVIRLDADSARRQGRRNVLLNKFKNREGNLLIGTQMITKDCSFPGVTLVGIISADISLKLPDFRAGERTFQLLTRLSSQAGKGGQVIIQTLNPQHYSFQAVKERDFRSFYKQEIKFRRELNYPPFNHFVNIIIRGENKKKIEESSQRLFSRLKEITKQKGIEILGPVSLPHSKIKGKYRRQIVLKAKDIKKIQDLLGDALKGFSSGKGIYLSVDVDPVSMF